MLKVPEVCRAVAAHRAAKGSAGSTFGIRTLSTSGTSTLGTFGTSTLGTFGTSTLGTSGTSCTPSTTPSR